MKGLRNYDHLGALSKADRKYWHYKELYLLLPYDYALALETGYYKNQPVLTWSDYAEKFLKSLPKLEQLIYTNEIQGE